MADTNAGLAPGSSAAGDFERFFASRPSHEGGYWRARFFLGCGYYRDRDRTLMREVRRAKAAAGADPWAFLRAFEAGIEADYHRSPRAREAAAVRWCEEIERLCGAPSAAAGGAEGPA